MRHAPCSSLVLSLMLATSLIGCHDRPDAPPARTDAPAPASAPAHDAPEAPPEPETSEQGESFDPKPPGPPGGNGVDELHRLEGQLDADLLREFGEPTTTREFTMGECCSEFEVELRNTYPPKSGHENVTIHQWDWDYEGYTLTVWLHQVEGQWVALETCRYSEGVEF